MFGVLEMDWAWEGMLKIQTQLVRFSLVTRVGKVTRLLSQGCTIFFTKINYLAIFGLVF
jgi:hypothetical protein